MTQYFRFVCVRVDRLNRSMQDIVQLWRLAGDPIDRDGLVLIDTAYKIDPKKAKRMFDFSFREFSAKTPLPFKPQ